MKNIISHQQKIKSTYHSQSYFLFNQLPLFFITSNYVNFSILDNRCRSCLGINCSKFRLLPAQHRGLEFIRNVHSFPFDVTVCLSEVGALKKRATFSLLFYDCRELDASVEESLVPICAISTSKSQPGLSFSWRIILHYLSICSK